MSAGYRFVPLPPAAHRTHRPHAVHDRRIPGTLTGVLDLTFRTEQAVHVGSGYKALHQEDTVVRTAATVRGAPGVPGSSLKGALRGRYEAITRSCAGEPPRGGSVRSQSHPDVKRATFTDDVRQADVFRRCRAEGLCAACALFGRMSVRSRVTVTDFVAEGAFAVASMREQFGPNAHHLGDFRIVDGNRGNKEFEVFRLEGRKFAVGEGPAAPKARWQPVEVIPAGTALRGSLRLVNVAPAELGGLLAALGRSPPSLLKLGAGKGQGFGRVALHGIEYRLQDHGRAPVGAEEAAWREAFERSADRWPAGEDALVRIHQGSC
jgi:CRISPR/Cas system CSM-associated protein Csm3 (group 7 of RAMP superfamily)